MVRLGIDYEPAMVRVSGPDPNGEKSSDRSFFTVQGEMSSLSASGIHFFKRPGGESRVGVKSDIVLTVASVLSPFLSASAAQRSRSETTIRSSWSFPLLQRNAIVSVGLESSGSAPTWHQAKLVALFDVAPADKVSSQLTGNKSSPPRQNSTSFATLAVLQLIDYQGNPYNQLLSEAQQTHIQMSTLPTSSTAPATDCPVLLLAALVGAVPVKHLLLFLLAVVKGPADGIGAAAAAGIEAAVACGGSVAVASALPVLSATVSDDCIWPLYGWRHR